MKYIFDKRHGNTDEACVKRTAEDLGISPKAAEILCQRVKPEDMEGFLKPDIRNMHDISLMRGAAEAAALIKKHVAAKNRIFIYGDYDADGICGSAIMYLTLKKMGADAHIYLPDRFAEGYGMNSGAVDSIIAQDGKLIITVDCGISNVLETDRAKKNGIDVIITDHHKCPEILPRANVIIDLKRSDESYPFKELCGAGVVFKLATALIGRDAFDFVDLAAVATVADMVPLLGENRIIAAKGIYKINKSPCIGIKTLFDAAGTRSPFTSENIAFGLAPRINAAGRLGNAKPAFALMTAKSAGESVSRCAMELCRLNSKRQEIQEKMTKEAEAMAGGGESCYICKNTQWDIGVVGLAASALTQRYARPAILFGGEGIITGSARSVNDIDIYDAVSSAKELLIKFGGHSGAAGMSLKEEHFEEFKARVNAFISAAYPPESFMQRRYYDIESELRDINEELAEQLSLLSPLGYKNEKVKILVRNAAITSKRAVGKGNHTKLTIEQGGASMSGIMFFAEPKDIPEGGDVLLSAEISDYSKKCEALVDVVSE